MENNKEIENSFNLVFTCPPYDSNDNLQGLEFIYRTEEIVNSTTTDEILKNTKNYLEQTIEKYNNYQDRDKELIETYYRLYIGRKVEKNGILQIEEEDLYIAHYLIDGEEKMLSQEKYFFNMHSLPIESNFFIYLISTVYFIEEEETETPRDIIGELLREIEESEEKIEEYNTKQSIHSSECVICLNNKPNILYFECGHIAVCNSCDSIGKFGKCPLCRREIKNQRIQI